MAFAALLRLVAWFQMHHCGLHLALGAASPVVQMAVATDAIPFHPCLLGSSKCTYTVLSPLLFSVNN